MLGPKFSAGWELIFSRTFSVTVPLITTVVSPKTDTSRSGQPLQRTSPVTRIEFAKHVILKQSPRSGQLRIPNNGQGTGPEWRVLMQNYLPRTDNQKLHPIIFMDITKIT